VLVTYLLLVLCGIPLLQVREGSIPYLAFVALLTVALVAICWAKGEPPRWRWGHK
jgi:hypothetical protein